MVGWGCGIAAVLIVAASTTTVLASVAEARLGISDQIGTPEQRSEAIAACGEDARRFCSAVKASDGAIAYLVCLETNRTRLTTRCVNLLARYGQ
jgi:hypothetical protein